MVAIGINEVEKNIFTSVKDIEKINEQRYLLEYPQGYAIFCKRKFYGNLLIGCDMKPTCVIQRNLSENIKIIWDDFNFRQVRSWITIDKLVVKDNLKNTNQVLTLHDSCFKSQLITDGSMFVFEGDTLEARMELLLDTKDWMIFIIGFWEKGEDAQNFPPTPFEGLTVPFRGIGEDRAMVSIEYWSNAVKLPSRIAGGPHSLILPIGSIGKMEDSDEEFFKERYLQRHNARVMNYILLADKPNLNNYCADVKVVSGEVYIPREYHQLSLIRLALLALESSNFGEAKLYVENATRIDEAVLENNFDEIVESLNKIILADTSPYKELNDELIKELDRLESIIKCWQNICKNHELDVGMIVADFYLGFINIPRDDLNAFEKYMLKVLESLKTVEVKNYKSLDNMAEITKDLLGKIYLKSGQIEKYNQLYQVGNDHP
ncbi:MAG: hypothetical protein JW804_05850 [Sedimentisphaerales bacterium]|nr:hypothetical protein [Sedimentisphaerales bacterium]